jgi:signal transduction histidine kinase
MIVGINVVTAIIVVLALFTPLIDKNEVAIGADRIITYGDLYFLWVITFVFNLILGLIILIIKIRKAIGIAKVQLLYLLLGFLLFFTIGIITNVVLTFFENYSLQQFSPLASIFFTGFTTYAIVRHRLLNIRLLVARSVAYAIIVFLVAAIYAVLIFWVSNLFFGNNINSFEATIFISVALFIAVTFQYVKEWVNRATDKVFFRANYNSNLLLSELASILAKTLRLEEISRSSLKEMLLVMHISKGAIYFHDPKSSFPPVLEGYSTDQKIDEKYIENLHNYSFVIVYDEVEDEELKRMMAEKDISVIMPIFSGDKRQGILVLGEKSNGEIYSEKDIEVIQIFGPELSVALDNAKAYEQIKRFNETLQQKVNEATLDLKQANEHLKELDKLKDEFVAIASHELRTPMTVARGNLWMILHEDKKLDKKTEERLKISMESLQSLISLVNDILDVSQIEGKGVKLMPQKIDIVNLIHEVKDEIGPLAKQKDIELSDSYESKKIEVFADIERVKRVLTNLIGNAIKFTDEKGKVTVKSSKNGKFVSIEVTDTGMGIRKEDIPKLFTKFGKIEAFSGKKLKAPGTGLGLYISKNLVEMSGGSISADSVVGKGSTFSFTLPVS